MPVEALRLAEHGIHGNGHMMMLEVNSDAIAAAIAARLPGGEGPWRFR